MLLLVAIPLISLQAVGHSGMFPDSFRFDDSNEGRRVNKKSAANTVTDNAVSASAVNTNTAVIESDKPCTNGLAGDYPCRNIHLQSLLGIGEMNSAGGRLNDVWGWTDTLTGMEVAIVGRDAGTSFVDITNPKGPVFLGYLRGHGGGAGDWRDIKVFQDYAFIVADGSSNRNHGLQIFDLTQLRNITPGAVLTEYTQLGGFGTAHNIAINEESGFAYIVGSDQCSGGLFMVDISNPLAPTFSGCFSSDGYTHDTQCVIYRGPDTNYFGKEICIAYNEDTISVVDVSNKTNPLLVSRTTYSGSQYTHQGWFLNDSHTYLIMNDELDERNTGVKTTSYLYDVSMLNNPRQTGTYVAQSNAIDHNLYTRDNFVFESNYRSGLRILSAENIAIGELSERAYFDTIPCSDTASFSGSWSSYIYFPSGNIVTSDIGTGLFILEPNWNSINDSSNNPMPTPAVSPVCDVSGGGVSNSGGGGGAWYWLELILLLLFGACKTVFNNKKYTNYFRR